MLTVQEGEQRTDSAPASLFAGLRHEIGCMRPISREPRKSPAVIGRRQSCDVGENAAKISNVTVADRYRRGLFLLAS
jgi:hypothetical protein